MGEYSAEHEKAFWALPKNPTLEKDLEVITSRDHSSLTLGDIVREFQRAAWDGASDTELCDILDRMFIYGAWKEITERLPMQGHLMLQDIRGMLVVMARGLKSREAGKRASEGETE